MRALWFDLTWEGVRIGDFLIEHALNGIKRNYAFDTMPLLTTKNTRNTKNGQTEFNLQFVATARTPQTEV